MGATQGTLNYKIFYVHGDLPENPREYFLPQIQDHAFQILNPDEEDEESVGWVLLDSPLRTDFAEKDVFYRDYLKLSFRHDKYVIPSSLLNAQFARAQEAYLQENQKKRLTKFEKEDLLLQLRIELKHQSIPRMAITDFVWNIPQNRVRFWSQSSKTCEYFQGLFFDTFGLVLIPSNPFNTFVECGFSEEEVAKLSDLFPARFVEEIMHESR